MKKIIDNWVWEIDDPDILESWFADFKSVAKRDMVKSNSQRDVFTIIYKNQKYFVKYSHPTSLFQKIRSSLSPKLLSEYNSSKLVEEAGLSIAKTVGVGYRGNESMLITKGVDDAMNGRTFWFSKCIESHAMTSDLNDKEKILNQEPRRKHREARRSKIKPTCGIGKLKDDFLDSFAEFLKKFIAANLYHPDFHLGNLMVSKGQGGRENGQSILITMIDPYGIEKVNTLSEEKLFEMLCIVGALRGELTNEDGGGLIQKILPSLSIDDANQKWLDIVEAERKKTVKLWEKRQGRILTDVRYSQLFEKEFGSIRIRKDFAYKLQLDEDFVIDLFKKYSENSDISGIYSIIKLNKDEAESRWIKSFELEFHRLAQKMPLAWIVDRDGSHYFISRTH